MTPRTIIPVLVFVLLLAACGRAEDKIYLGYVEGDFLRLGPREAGLVTALAAREGDSVAAGAPLFSIDSERARLSVAEAEARMQAARARMQDLMRGGRPQEVAAAEQLLAAARAELDLAQRDFARTQDLAEQDAAPRAQLDTARRTLAATQARVAELQSRAELVGQPAREDQIAAAEREAEAAQAELDLAREALSDRAIPAPAAGRVDRIYLREGEYAAAGQPVLSLLPPGNVKAVFFTPEPELSALAPGDPVTLDCDGCAAPLRGVVSHIAAQAEFAPPVIYSEDARARLVFRVEARPAEGQDWGLVPGQPVQVRLPE
jgi:HlyD family secretion protein